MLAAVHSVPAKVVTEDPCNRLHGDSHSWHAVFRPPKLQGGPKLYPPYVPN